MGLDIVLVLSCYSPIYVYDIKKRGVEASESQGVDEIVERGALLFLNLFLRVFGGISLIFQRENLAFAVFGANFNLCLIELPLFSAKSRQKYCKMM